MHKADRINDDCNHNMPLYKLNNGKEKVSGWNEAEESHPLAYIKRKERENACLNSS